MDGREFSGCVIELLFVALVVWCLFASLYTIDSIVQHTSIRIRWHEAPATAPARPKAAEQEHPR